MNERTASVCVLVSAVFIAGCAVSGCQSIDKRAATASVSEERLRDIEPLDLRPMAVPETGAPPAAPPAAAPAAPEVRLSLEECRAAALENNLDLKVALVSPSIAAASVTEAEARFEALFFSDAFFGKTDDFSPLAGASRSEATTADMGFRFPLRTGGTVTLDFPASRSDTPGAAPSYDTDARFRLSQPLLRGGWLRANTHAIRIARYQSQASEARAKLEVIRVIAETDRVYWRLYAARRELEVRRNEYDLAVAQLDRARRRVQAGAASEVEITRAETGVAERTEAIIIADNALRQRERSLKRALNRPTLPMDAATVLVPATEPNPVRYTLEAPRLVKAALDNRMDMLEVELQIAQDASTIDFERNQALPSLALEYTYNVNGAGSSAHDSLGRLNDRDFEDHTVGLSLEVPLGNAAAKSRLRQAILSRVQRLATRDARASQIRQEVLDAIDQIQTAWQRIVASRQRTTLAERNLSAEIRQFDLGLRTSTDVLDAQTRLANAQSAEIAALADYQIAQTDLAYSTGMLLGAASVRWQPSAGEKGKQ